MNEVSFKSRINFVNEKTFDNFMKGEYIDFRPSDVMNYLDIAMQKKEAAKIGYVLKNPRLDVLKADEFYTDTVRTCTAGGVLNTKTGEAVGFHIFDSLYNLNKVDNILENIFARVKEPDRALILGSKKLSNSINSIPIFKKLCQGISERVPNVTMFREHVFPYSETDMHYCAKNDTWTIHSMFRPLTDIKIIDVLSKESLDKAFKEVKIAKGDTISFA